MKNSKITMATLVKIWAQEETLRKGRTNYVIHRQYRCLKLHICSYFADMPLNKLSPSKIKKWESDCIVNSDLKQSSKYYICSNLNSLLIFASKNGYIDEKKLDSLLIKANKYRVYGKIKLCDEETFTKIISIIENETYRLMLRLQYYHGIALDELLALTMKDIDLQNGLINVNKNLVREGGVNHLHLHKDSYANKDKERLVKISPELNDELAAYCKSNHDNKRLDERIFDVMRYKIRDAKNNACKKLSIDIIPFNNMCKLDDKIANYHLQIDSNNLEKLKRGAKKRDLNEFITDKLLSFAPNTIYDKYIEGSLLDIELKNLRSYLSQEQRFDEEQKKKVNGILNLCDSLLKREQYRNA